MKDYELPQCENCKWSLGIEQVRKSLVIGNKLFCDKCRPTKRAPDVKPRRAVKAKTRKASRG